MTRLLLFAAVSSFLSCSPAVMGEAELSLTVAPGEIDDHGGVAVVRVVATDAAGLIGKGTVKLTSTAGSAVTAQEQTLDAYGTARFDFTCVAATDVHCVGPVTLTVDWVVDGRRVSATKQVAIIPPTQQLHGWESDVVWDANAQTTRCNGSAPPMAPACQAGMCARGFACVDGLCLLNGRGGGLQYTLRFGESVDLDLHVEEPLATSTCEVWWGDPNRLNRPSMCSATASLDLDSNAACHLDNVNIENVIFPNTNNARPRSGTYVARVDLYAACMFATPIAWELEVRTGGASRFYCGTFMPSEADAGGARSGKLISTIVIP